METAVKKLYEAMFLVDSAQASDWDAVVKTIETVLKRADAEVVSIKNWAERKLAYEIDHKTRGTYVLCFFKADGSAIPGIEKDVQLSEQILRVLVLTTETREQRDLEKDMFGTQDEKQTAIEDKDADISSPQKVDKADDTASPQGPEAEEVRQSAPPDVSDAIEPPLSPEPGPLDAIEPTLSPEPGPLDAIEPPLSLEPGPTDAIEPQPTETDQDAAEKDAAD